MTTLNIQWANKHSMVDTYSTLRTSSDIPVVRLEELQRWLEEHEEAMDVCIDTLLTELTELKQAQVAQP